MQLPHISKKLNPIITNNPERFLPEFDSPAGATNQLKQIIMKNTTVKLLFKESDMTKLRETCQKYGVEINRVEKQNSMFGTELTVQMTTQKPENLYLLGLNMFKIGHLINK